MGKGIIAIDVTKIEKKKLIAIKILFCKWCRYW